jgi:hypothetical protein
MLDLSIPMEDHMKNTSYHQLIFGSSLLMCMFFMAVVCQAEWCDKIGCQGEVGYVFIPDSQRFIRSGQSEYRLNDTACRLKGRRIFQEFGVPEVNAIATIGANTALLSESGIVFYEQEIIKEPFIFDISNKTATIREYNVNGPSLVARGARVKILSYRYISIGKGDQSKLFALVLYVSDN